MASVASQIALMVTRRCDMACSHCSVASGPHVKDEPTEGELLHRVQEAAAAGVQLVTLTGGEPMLREELILRLIRECRRLGMATRVVTDGFWGRNAADAKHRLQALRKAGLGFLTVSHDRYHAAFQDHVPALHIARAAETLLFRIDVHLVRGTDDSDLPRLIEPFEGLKHVRLRFYDLQPVGRARLLPADTFRAEVEGFCSSCAFPAVTDDGRVLACNGPAYFTRPDSLLQIGSMKDVPLRTLLERHWTDPVLDTIRTLGPSGLRDELRRIPGFEQFPFRDHYAGMCDLCHHITGKPDAVAALRTRLAAPARLAQRQAISLVIQTSRGQGPLSRQYVNSVGACRVFDRLARGGLDEWRNEADQVLGRADIDWTRLGAYLSACGLARPLAHQLTDPVLARWAPPFFLERLASRAVQEAERELIQQEALSRMAGVLREAGTRAVLLEGSMLPLEPAGRRPCRATPALHLYLRPSMAAPVRQALVQTGFSDLPGTGRTGRLGAALLRFDDVPVVIHQRIMPAWWNLPEQDMLDRSVPMDGAYRDVFSTLSPEGVMLHAGMQSAATFFSCGLKTAWDLRWILEYASSPDWDRLVRWVNAARVPRGFWTTVGVLAASVDLPVPADVLRRGPADTRQQKISTIARHLLFTGWEAPQAANPFSKTGVALLLHDTWLTRLGYLAAVTRRGWVEEPRVAVGVTRTGGLRTLLPLFREAWLNWRDYRITWQRRQGALKS